MQHNVYLEWSINGKAYFQAYRGLCKMRIEYVKAVIEGWEKKLKESYIKEKEYFGE